MQYQFRWSVVYCFQVKEPMCHAKTKQTDRQRNRRTRRVMWPTERLHMYTVVRKFTRYSWLEIKQKSQTKYPRIKNTHNYLVTCSFIHVLIDMFIIWLNDQILQQTIDRSVLQAFWMCSKYCVTFYDKPTKNSPAQITAVNSQMLFLI